MVLAFRYGDDMNDGVDDEIEDSGNHFHSKTVWHSGTVMMMNDSVDDEIEDSGNHFHSKMVLEYDSHKPFPQQNGFGIPVR